MFFIYSSFCLCFCAHYITFSRFCQYINILMGYIQQMERPQKTPQKRGKHLWDVYILSKIKGFFGCVSHGFDVGADVVIEGC